MPSCTLDRFRFELLWSFHKKLQIYYNFKNKSSSPPQQRLILWSHEFLICLKIINIFDYDVKSESWTLKNLDNWQFLKIVQTSKQRRLERGYVNGPLLDMEIRVVKTWCNCQMLFLAPIFSMSLIIIFIEFAHNFI